MNLGVKETVNYLKGDSKGVKTALKSIYYNNEPLPQGVEDEIDRLCEEYIKKQKKKGR